MGKRPRARKPSFMQLLLKDFSKKLLIPPEFVRLHRGTLAKKCVLRPTGTQDSWRVRTKQIYNSLYFKKGWKKFAQHHSLGFGDLLVFRYAQDCEFHVDMFDKSCCFKDSITSQNVGSTRDTTSMLPSVGENKSCQTRKRRSGKALQAHSSQALEAACKFSSLSTYPSYACAMHFSYVQKTFLYVPITFVKQMNATARAIKVKLQYRGKEWDAVASTYGTTSKINYGWSTFVWENSLQIGDACVLELINRKDALIRVTIFRCTN